MKVALFSRYPADSNHPRGGVESVTVVLVKALAQLDDLDIHLVALEHERTKTTVEQDGDITVHRLPRPRWPEILDIIGGPGRKRLVKYILNLTPDVLHSHESYGLFLNNLHIPHVFTVHGFDHANLVANAARFAWIRSPLWKLVERWGLGTQKHTISISPYVRAMIESQTHAHIYEIDNPVDEQYFNIECCSEPGRILCVGWINERKNTLGSIQAFTRITERFPNARLIIAGESTEIQYFNQVKMTIHRFGLDHRVEILGHINHIELKKELARASVFLLPSRQENSPMAIAEAMAAGLPVIASDRCGMPYMIQEGQSGFLIDPESTEQITDRLSKLVGFPQLCRQMGQAGRRVAMKRFHPHAVAQKTKAVYERICASAS